MVGHYTHTMLDKIYSFRFVVIDEKLKDIISLSMTCITLLNQHTSLKIQQTKPTHNYIVYLFIYL